MTLLSTLASITIIGTSSLLVSGHTWIDSIQCNGGPKYYIRGYKPRSVHDLNHQKKFDEWNTYKIESRTSTANMCAPTQQDKTPDIDLLRCPAGSTVTLTYNPNGHVTKDKCEEGDPRVCRQVQSPAGAYDSRTTYWTIAAKAWTSDGQVPTVLRKDVADPSYAGPTNDQPYPKFEAFDNLISSGFKKPFADGTCGEFNGVPTPCKGTFRIPEDTAEGGMQFMFYWVFDRAYSGAGEEYTSCFDIKVTNSKKSSKKKSSKKKSNKKKSNKKKSNKKKSNADTAGPRTSVTKVGTFSEPSTPSTPALKVPTPPTLPTAGASSCIASGGDQAVGIQQYHDQNCGTSNGDNLGCVAETKCRFCRSGGKNDKNEHLRECPSVVS